MARDGIVNGEAKRTDPVVMAIYIMLVIVILMTEHSVLTDVRFLPRAMSAVASISFRSRC